ncbi:hypothetical protein Btru_049559 [Bulinus truncatus]|nr:hypothetical protein Btru_049559 [Bulinus truncatus]
MLRLESSAYYSAPPMSDGIPEMHVMEAERRSFPFGRTIKKMYNDDDEAAEDEDLKCTFMSSFITSGETSATAAPLPVAIAEPQLQLLWLCRLCLSGMLSTVGHTQMRHGSLRMRAVAKETMMWQSHSRVMAVMHAELNGSRGRFEKKICLAGIVVQSRFMGGGGRGGIQYDAAPVAMACSFSADVAPPHMAVEAMAFRQAEFSQGLWEVEVEVEYSMTLQIEMCNCPGAAPPHMGVEAMAFRQAEILILLATMPSGSHSDEGVSQCSLPNLERRQIQEVQFHETETLPFSLPVEYSMAQVSESTTSTTYEIARQSTIPSDNTEHKVTVAIIDLKPTLSYLTVPKVVPHAFLQAKVVNSSPYTLLAGRTNIFLDNSFVAKAEIKNVSPKEEFECSLGVDPSVRVDYKPVNKVTSSSGLISKSHITTYEQNIEIKNLHNYSVKVLVRDNLPRSLDEKIKVNILVPAIDSKHPEKNEGVKLTKSNYVEWDLEIKQMDKADVVFKYTVEHPASEDIETTTAFGN